MKLLNFDLTTMWIGSMSLQIESFVSEKQWLSENRQNQSVITLCWSFKRKHLSLELIKDLQFNMLLDSWNLVHRYLRQHLYYDLIKGLRKTLRFITSRWRDSLKKSFNESSSSRNSWNKETHWNSNERCNRCDCSPKLRREIMHLRWQWKSERICFEKPKKKRIHNGKRSKRRL